jgi:hypothetical protein
MYKLFIIFFSLIFLISKTEKKYVIVAGDITCKACVIQLHAYLYKTTKKHNLLLALRNKGNIILNESGVNYFQKEIPNAEFIFLDKESFFPKKEKYPYLLIVLKKDTVKMPYDSLFYGEAGHLNIKHLK